MSVVTKALQTHTVLDQVISELPCSYSYLLVSKFWASIAIPKLWADHGDPERLMDDSWKRALFRRPVEGSDEPKNVRITFLLHFSC